MIFFFKLNANIMRTTGYLGSKMIELVAGTERKLALHVLRHEWKSMFWTLAPLYTTFTQWRQTKDSKQIRRSEMPHWTPEHLSNPGAELLAASFHLLQRLHPLPADAACNIIKQGVARQQTQPSGYFNQAFLSATLPATHQFFNWYLLFFFIFIFFYSF